MAVTRTKTSSRFLRSRPINRNLTATRKPFATAVAGQPWTGRIAVLLAIAAAALNLRIAVTAVSPLLTLIAQEIGFGTTVMGLFGTLPLAAFAVVGLLTPRVIRTIGPEATTALSMAVLAVGEVTRTYATTTLGLTALTGIALIGTALGNVCIPPLITKYFPDRSGTLNTVQLVAINAGGLLPPLLAVPVAHMSGWRTALGIWAIPAAVAAILWLLQWHRNGRKAEANQSTERSRRTDGTPGHMWRTPRAWALAGLYGLASSNVFILFTWLPTLLTTAGQPPEVGGQMVSLVIGVSLLASFVVPRLVHRLNNTFPLTLTATASFAAGYAGLAIAPNTAPFLWSLLLGLGCTLFSISLTFITTHVTTTAGASSLSGFVQGVGCAIALFGPMLFGLAHTVTGTWALSYIIVAGGSITVITVLGWAVRHRHPVDRIISGAAP
jgi:MFS transporter, CP family, cyanate transporter